MKALNFKKTAMAVALASTAGSAVAANTINVITGDVDTQVVASASLTDAQKAYVAVAKEIAAGTSSAQFQDSAAVATGANAGSAEALANSAMVRLAMQVAPIDGQFLTFEFANGGVRFPTSTPTLIAYSAARNKFMNFSVAPQVVAQPTISGTDTTATSITFRLGDVTINDTSNSDEIGTNDFIFLADGNVAATGAPIATASIQGPDLYVNPGIAAGAKVSVDVILRDTNNQAEVTNSQAAAVEFAEAYTALSVNNLSTATDVIIDYAADALKFTNNSTQATRTATNFVERKTPGSTLAGKATSTVTYGQQVFGSFDLVGSNCAAINTADDATNTNADVVIFGHNATASSVNTCSWGVSAQEVTIDGDPSVSVRVDGSTVIQNASWSYTGTLTLGTTADKDSVAANWMSVSGNVFNFTSDVQGDSIQIPYVYHIGSASGYSSLVKVTNKNLVSSASTATNMVELAFNAVIKNTTTGEEFSVENYKLADVNNQGQVEITGTDVIAALITPAGKASDGFNETAMDLDTAHNFHIALDLIPRNQNNNTNFFVDVQNTSPVGRAQGSVEYSAH